MELRRSVFPLQITRIAVVLSCPVRAAILALLGLSVLPAQPLIHSRGVVNAAGYQPADSPGGAIAQGSIFSLFGSGLGPSPGVAAPALPLDPVLAGVSVRLVHQSGAAALALPLFVSDSQINAILPSWMPVGLVSVSVAFQSQVSAAERIKVVRSSFGIFTRNGLAVAQNYLSLSEQPLNSPGNPAAPGQMVVLWGTGLGPITVPDGEAPAPGSLAEPVELALGGRPVAIDYQGRSGCCAGADQINFRIPADAPSGCGVPLSVKLQNGVYSNIATIAVGTGGRPCTDPWNLPGSARRWGEIRLARAVFETGNADAVTAVFGEGEPPTGLPPAGSCVSARTDPPGKLDAGPQLTLTGPQGARPIPREGSGRYTLGGGSPFLGPGTYTVAGPGGTDVGPLSVTLAAPAPLAWSPTSGSRSRGITLSWSAGDAGGDPVILFGPGFLCTAAARAGAFTLPPEVLSNLPAAGTVNAGVASRAGFTASGLDQAMLSYTLTTARTVVFGEPPLAATPVILPGGRRILAELAVTSPEQERGLMQRDELAPDHGMLFLFSSSNFYSFWMYRTLIPLDLIWMDQDRRIVFISANTPPCRGTSPEQCPLYGGKELSQSVLEIGAGLAAQYGLRAGDRLAW